MMLDECVETLLFLQSIAEMEYTKIITDVGCMRNRGADAELEKPTKGISEHAYHLVEKNIAWPMTRRLTTTLLSCDRVFELTSATEHSGNITLTLSYIGLHIYP